MEYDLISVIMSTYNEKETWIKQSIESILNQTYKNIEFIIVLDNPENIILDNIIENYRKKDRRIIYIKNDINKGLVYSLNRAISMSKGKYIARMDADDISLNMRLEKQKKYLEENKLDFIGTNVINFNDNGEFTSNYPQNTKDIYKYLNSANAMAHPTWFLKREVFQKVGQYRNIFANEDYDFLLRCRNQNIKIGNMDKPLLKYRLSSNSISRSNIFEQQVTTYFLSKNFNRINSITENEINKFLAKFNDKVKNRYLNAYSFAYKSSLLKKNNFRFWIYKFKALTISLLYFRIRYLRRILIKTKNLFSN